MLLWSLDVFVVMPNVFLYGLLFTSTSDFVVQSLDGKEGEAPAPVDEATAFLRKGNRDFRNSRFKEVSGLYLSTTQRMTMHCNFN